MSAKPNAVEAKQTESQADTVVTTRGDDGSLEYHPAPEFEYNVGDTVLEDEIIDLWIDGDLQEVDIEKAVVVNRGREFVVDECEWYIEYDVKFIDKYGGRSVKTERLSQDDLIES